jgi:hypothetical protein
MCISFCLIAFSFDSTIATNDLLIGETVLSRFPTRENYVAVIKEFYKERNVVLHLHKSSDKQRVIFKCYHSGNYRTAMNLDDQRSKCKTSSK